MKSFLKNEGILSILSKLWYDPFRAKITVNINLNSFRKLIVVR